MPEVKVIKIIIFFALAFFGPASGARTASGIVLSPQLTETLFQLGRGQRIQATVSPNAYPPEARTLPIVGFSFFPSFEKIAQYNPSWVLSDASIANTPTERALESAPYLWLHENPDGLRKFLANVRQLESRLFGNASVPLADKVELCVSKLRASPFKPFTFVGIAWVQPAMLFGHTTFLSDIFTLFGGRNLLPEHTQHSYPSVSFEWLAVQKPDVVFFLTQMDWDLERTVEAELSPYWNFPSMKIVKLKADDFGRASFTPFFKLKNVAEKLGLELPAACEELS